MTATVLFQSVVSVKQLIQPLSTDTGVAEHSISTDFSVKMSLDSIVINIQSTTLEIVLTVNQSNPASVHQQQACNIVPCQESYSRSEENQVPFSGIQESEDGDNGTSKLVISATKQYRD